MLVLLGKPHPFEELFIALYFWILLYNNRSLLHFVSDLPAISISKRMDEACLFCKILNGTIPSKKVNWVRVYALSLLMVHITCAQVFEDDKCVALLDAFPCTDMHVLVLPKVSDAPKQHTICKGSYSIYLLTHISPPRNTYVWAHSNDFHIDTLHQLH